GGVTFPSAGYTQDRDSALVAGTATWTGTRAVSESSVQYSRFRWNYGRPVDGASPQVMVQDPAGSTIAVLGHPGFVFDDLENTMQLKEKVTYAFDRHTLKLGAELLTSDFALAGGGNVNGNYTVRLTDAQLADVRAR